MKKILLILFLLATIIILPSFAFAEVRKEYYPSGKLKGESSYVNGKREGITKDYYSSGELLAEFHLKNGKREGIAKIYYESGKLMEEVNYANDKPEGIFKRILRMLRNIFD